jgi:hypothetical protein
VSSGAVLEAYERVADDFVALDRQDQEAVPGPESVKVQSAATLPGKLVVLDQTSVSGALRRLGLAHR